MDCQSEQKPSDNLICKPQCLQFTQGSKEALQKTETKQNTGDRGRGGCTIADRLTGFATVLQTQWWCYVYLNSDRYII